MDAYQIARTIKLKSGIEWSPNKEFSDFRTAAGIVDMIESNTDWKCEMISVDQRVPFGKQWIRINGH